MTRRGAPLGGDGPPAEGRGPGEREFQHRTDSDHRALAARAPPPPNEKTGLGWGGGGAGGRGRKEEDLSRGPSEGLDGGEMCEGPLERDPQSSESGGDRRTDERLNTPPPSLPRQHSHRETQEVDLLSVSDSRIGHEKAGSPQMCRELWVEDLDLQDPAELWNRRLKTCPTIWDSKKRLVQDC